MQRRKTLLNALTNTKVFLNKEEGLKILETYSGLWRIEESFRITKSQFEARPIFVRTKKHIEGHF